MQTMVVVNFVKVQVLEDLDVRPRPHAPRGRHRAGVEREDGVPHGIDLRPGALEDEGEVGKFQAGKGAI